MDGVSANLLMHRDFVARIARRLIDDEAEVEDIVQETCLAALRQQPRTITWWARVARNLSIDRLRRRAARQRRELAAARPEKTASTAELAERVAWQQRVVEAVLELELPYREVVLLRFFEELWPREIAARLELPVNTVRTRLRRALKQLKGRLEREAGGPDALHTALAPLALFAAPAKAAAVPTAATAFTMKNALLLLVLIAAGVTITGLLALRTGSAGTAGSQRSAVRDLAGAVAEPASADTIPDGSTGSVAATVVGHLPKGCVDQGGVRMTIRSPKRIVHTEIVSTGTMRLRYPRESDDLRLEVSGPRILKMSFPLTRRETELGEIRIARSLSFGGRLFTMEGKPMVGAVIHWNSGSASSETADEQGRYRIEAPATAYGLSTNNEGLLRGVRLMVEHKGRWGGPFGARPSGFALKYDFRADLEDPPTLQFVGVADARLRLFVYDPGPVSAVLGDAVAETRTDDEGVARPRWPPWMPAAFATLQLPGGEELQMTLNREDVCASDPYKVAMDETAAVSLKVVDGDGKPAHGASLRIIGSWSPDGLRIHDNGRFEVETGAREVRLFGEVPRDGVISWRFLANNPQRGVFLPFTWTCETNGRVLRDEFVTKQPKDAALSGGALPTLVVEYGRARQERALVIDGVVSCGGLDFFLGQELVASDESWREMTTQLANGKRQTVITPEATRVKLPKFDRLEMVLTLANSKRTIHLTRAEWAAAIAGKVLVIKDQKPVIGRIRVLDADGKPAPNVLVSVDADDWAPRCGTDGHGVAVLELPGPGPFPALAVDPLTRQAGILDRWTPGGREQTLRLRRPRSLRFRVLYPDRKPYRRFVNLLSPRSLAGSFGVRGDRDGWFTTPPIVPELFDLTVFSWWKERMSARLKIPLRDVAPNQELQLKVRKR